MMEFRSFKESLQRCWGEAFKWLEVEITMAVQGISQFMCKVYSIKVDIYELRVS